MPFTYSGNPGYSAKDLTRYLLGDTDPAEPLLQDQEIIWVLSQYNNTPMNAAIRCCETIVALFSRRANESVGKVKIDYKQQSENYRSLQQDLRRRLAMEDGTPYCGGISVSDKMTVAQNTDRVRPDFTKQMMDNWQYAPWVGNNDLGLMGGWDGDW